jgi:hydrogenase maturation protein HypF
MRLRITGVVQGVGFRPFVYRLASRLGLEGAVWNDGVGVVVEVVGGPAALEGFIQGLNTEAPPAAVIDHIARQQADDLATSRSGGFRIAPSRSEGRVMAGVSPDLATCAQCLADIADPANRRFAYAFSNCTDCGPRLSILEDVPYDRAATTMAAFTMCPDCRREYDDPGDRRFHAQPNACPECGPSLRFERCADQVVLTAWPALAIAFWDLIGRGDSVAIKGIGGYHLACLATDERAVASLRTRKRRPHKPLAVMARSLDVLRRHCMVSAAEARLLSGPGAPILLLRPRADHAIAASVAPAQHRIGAMLPYSPLHHLLFEGRDDVLVMTSGNRSEQPQIIDDEEAARVFAEIGDAILSHDRRIAVRVDDSVVRFDGRKPAFLRLGRGFTPLRLAAPPGLERAPDVVALGAQLKATFCLGHEGRLVLSQHIGDLQHTENREALATTLRHYLRLYDVRPERIALDLHPDVGSGGFADELGAQTGARLIRVQHHHAHAAACLAEHAYPNDGAPVLAIVLDGLGYGPDGTLWGFEFLSVCYTDYRRLAHLKPVAMPGGEAAIREPWRMALAYLAEQEGFEALRRAHPELPLLRNRERQCRLLLQAVTRHINAPLTSSCGRLFDAVAALALAREQITYEGQAAAELEAALWNQSRVNSAGAGYRLELVESGDGLPMLDPRPIWPALLVNLKDGCASGEISRRFHLGLVDGIVAMVGHLAVRHPELPRSAVLSGGALQNAFLLRALQIKLARSGWRVLTHRKLPPNDGGLSAGQAVIAAASEEGSGNPCA